jgi:type III pantothenate kinase
MSQNLLAINIGNTRTQLGTFVDGQLTRQGAVENVATPEVLGRELEEAYAPLRDAEDAAVVLGSVNPKVEARVAGEVSARLGAKLVRVEDDLPIPIGRQLDPESIIGDDRLLNAAAAYDVLKQACVVVDAGTAITIDFIDGVGTFHGGAIAAGAQMMLDSLHQRTAQLPEVQFDTPVEPIGHNTVEAMRAAAYHGIRGMVRELVELYAEQAGVYPLVIATGGDARRLFEGYDMIDRLVPELTLMGIAATWRVAMEKQ